MKIEIWSDFACPFCYIGETRALKAIENNKIEDVEVVFRNFQLNPQATAHPDKNIHTLLAEKYQLTYDQAVANNQHIAEEAQKSGLNYDFDNMKSNNTRMAHELTRFAEESGQEKEMAEALFSAYFENGIDIGIKENLIVLAEQVGLEGQAVKKVLDQGIYTEQVMKDQALAASKGITSVPYFIINDKFAISGAQSQAYFDMALKQVAEQS